MYNRINLLHGFVSKHGARLELVEHPYVGWIILPQVTILVVGGTSKTMEDTVPDTMAEGEEYDVSGHVPEKRHGPRFGVWWLLKATGSQTGSTTSSGHP